MKTSIHPPYYPHAKIQCVCGNKFTTGSTKELLEIEICSQCHPFYTGQKKVIDAAGRVERYRRMVARASNTKIRKSGADDEHHKKNEGDKAVERKAPKAARPEQSRKAPSTSTE